MVFFTCNSCGNALKKNQVERHMMGCGQVVSCIDCLKDFRGNEFKSHVKCISEAEKYNGPDWKAPSSQNKGERKQMAWVETVNEALENGRKTMTPGQIALLKAISKHDNVPRKKPKFLNFVRNVAKNNFDQFTIDAVWDAVDAEWKKQAEQNKPAPPPSSSNGNGTSHEAEAEPENGVKEDEEGSQKKKSKKKRKLEQEEEENKESKKKKGRSEEAEEDHGQNGDADDSVAPDSTTEFHWGTVIQEILSAREDKTISLKKLKKKVFAEYYAVVGDSKGVKTKEDLTSQLNKKLKKKRFHLVGENVRLAVVD